MLFQSTEQMKKNTVRQQQINSKTCAIVNTGIFAIMK